jgi:hypothetical protein
MFFIFMLLTISTYVNLRGVNGTEVLNTFTCQASAICSCDLFIRVRGKFKSANWQSKGHSSTI